MHVSAQIESDLLTTYLSSNKGIQHDVPEIQDTYPALTLNN